MKEKIYTIPVLDAMKSSGECPLCSLYTSLETQTIEFVMGPSYMEDDIRSVTNELGFCLHHISSLYSQANRLGTALILSTHMNKVITDLKKIAKKASPNKTKGLFAKKSPSLSNETKAYIQKLEDACYICQKIEHTMARYIDTFFYLLKSDSNFKTLLKDSKGFCTHHYSILLETAPSKLSGSQLDEFITLLNQLYFDNMDRVKEDLEWFIQKFDYRYSEEPWKNSKDALVRAIQKMNHTILND